MKTPICILWICCLIGVFSSAQYTKMSAEELWSNISQDFVPTTTFANDFGEFRSPLMFQDGSKVMNAKDWERRQEEILAHWHQMMGKWPPVLTNQKLTIVSSEEREDFIEHKIRFRWLPNEITDGYLLIPRNIKKKSAAIITVYYEPETAIGKGKELRDFAYQLTKRGFITLSIGTSLTTKSKKYALYWPNIENATVEPLSILAYAAANAWHVLANRPEVDAERIGIIGHSYGGKWAMFASCLYDKFACAVWSDGGIIFNDNRPNVNYWEPWYLGYHNQPWRKRGLITLENPAQGTYSKLREQGDNLHELHTLMAPRPFLVSGGEEDQQQQWKALNHSVAINKLLGYKNRVAMTNRPEHSPTKESNEHIYWFFEYFLMAGGLNR